MRKSNLIYGLPISLALLAGAMLYGKNLPGGEIPYLNPIVKEDFASLLSSGKVYDAAMTETDMASRKAPMRTIVREGFLYEDFEDMTPLKLSNGWTATATPGLAGDIWNVATLGSGDNTIQGPSGDKYAFILGNRDAKNPIPHDSWLFSPAVSLEKGVTYDIDFWTYLAQGAGVGEELEVFITSAPTGDAIEENLDFIEGDENMWIQRAYEFTPTESGEYHIAFHSLSKAMSNATLIDDVKISVGNLPTYGSTVGVNFGDVDMVAAPFTTEFRVSNAGEVALELNLISASPEIKVKGLPAIVQPGSFKRLDIEFTPSKEGPYMGEYTLSTNDPRHPEVQLIAMANVLDVPLTCFVVEDFESPGPKGWIMPFGVVNTDFVGGHNGPRAMYTRGFYSIDENEEIGFTSHYVEMGENPEIEMWCRFISCDLLGNQLGALSGDVPMLDVLVSDDYGKKWEKVWSMRPDNENRHSGDADFYPISISLPQYAGKTCRVKTVVNNAMPHFENDFILLIDDVAIGTRPAVALKASGLNSTASVSAGKQHTVSLTVENLGTENSSQFEVNLTDGEGNVIATTTHEGLTAGGKSNVNLSWIPEATGPMTLQACVNSPEDSDTRDNSTNVMPVMVTDDSNSVITIDDSRAGTIPDIPICLRTKESAVQTIYYANEIGIDAGKISSIVFTSAFDVDHLTENFDVYLAETERTDFADSEWVPDSEFTKVFDGQFFLPAGKRDFTIPFDKPFEYKGGNIIVMTRKISNSFITTKSFVVHESKEPRTLQATAVNSGQLISSNYDLRNPVDVYAHMSVNMVKPDHGSVTGTVKDFEGTVSDADVRLDRTMLNRLTGKKGTFTFPEISTGKHSFTVTKYGYYPSTGNIAEVSKDEETAIEIILTPFPRKCLEGYVRDAEGNPIASAKVVLEGYSNYLTETDVSGHYRIEDIYADTGVPYELHIESPYYDIFWKHGLDIDRDTTCDATLHISLLRAHNPIATENNDEVSVEWEAPLTELAHDNGKPKQFLGWSHGHSKTAIFSTYHRKMNIKEIRWYLSDSEGPHANINLLIFGLNADGRPDNTRILWSKTGVPFTDNQWCSYILEQPIEAENFAIAISGDGFLGLGATESDSEHPFSSGMHFFSGDNYEMDWDILDFDVFDTLHPMLRVCGEYLDEATIAVTRPTVEYDVYRYDSALSTTSRKLLGTTSELYLKDETYSELDKGTYRYGVVARYNNGEATEVYSNSVKKTTTEVNAICADDIEVEYDNTAKSVKFGNSSLVKSLSIHAADGTLVKKLGTVAESNSVADLGAGVYILSVHTNDGNSLAIKINIR